MEDDLREVVDRKFEEIFGSGVFNSYLYTARREDMCGTREVKSPDITATKTIPVGEAVGMVLAHDVTEIRKDEFKGRAFKKGHIIRAEDIDHFRKLGKEHLFVLSLGSDEIHEDDAALALASAIMGAGVRIEGEPREGKINIIAERDGLLKVNRDSLLEFNMLGDVMCATRHGNTVVKKGRVVAGTRAIPLVVKRDLLDNAISIGERARSSGTPLVEVKELKKPKTGIVITGNEVYYGKIRDAFASVITKKIEEFGGDIVGIYYAPDDAVFIEQRLRELVNAGAELLIATGGMSVDPDDVTRFAIRNLGAADMTYGSAVLPGAMVLVSYLNKEHDAEGREQESSAMIPILGIPACGMYHKITVFDLLLPRVLAGDKIGRRELAELGNGGLCLNCKTCRYPVCPFGK